MGTHLRILYVRPTKNVSKFECSRPLKFLSVASDTSCYLLYIFRGIAQGPYLRTRGEIHVRSRTIALAFSVVSRRAFSCVTNV